MTNKICLNMIVKNEEATLPRLLASVRDQISCYVIVDTGSTDSTWGVIERELAEVPGRIIHSTFENFSQARNEAITEAEYLRFKLDWDYLLLADADMELVGTLPELTAPAYLVQQQASGLVYDNIRLVHRNAEPIYEGYTHEVLLHSGQRERIDPNSAIFLDHTDGANRPDKFARDIRLLTHEVADAPTNARAWFYLAQSHKDAGNRALARALYEHRATSVIGWEEETWYAMLQVAALTEDSGQGDEVTAAYHRAYGYRPHRAEPLRWLARYFERKGKDELAAIYHRQADQIPYPADDILFIDASSYKTGPVSGNPGA